MFEHRGVDEPRFTAKGGRALMRRLLTVSAVAALMAAMMVVMAAPAMADDLFDDGIIILSDNDDCDFDGFNNNLFGIFGNDEDCDFNDLNDLNGIFGIDNGFFGNEVDQESQSGDVSLGFDVSNTGKFASQCTPATQFGNTGNFQNGSSFVQGSGGDLDDFEPGGIEVAFGGDLSTDCSNTIGQSSAASS